MNTMLLDEFVKRWQNTTLSERASYQTHFINLCAMIGHETPKGDGLDSRGHHYAFEYGLIQDTGAHGFADVLYENHFAIEYNSTLSISGRIA